MKAYHLFTLLALSSCLCPPAEARFKKKDKTIRVQFYGVADYALANSDADKLANATYRQNYATPLVIGGGLGILIASNWYIGGRFEHWIATRDYTQGSSSQLDTLTLQTIGAEFGLYERLNRLFILFAGGASFPITLEVDTVGTTSDVFTSDGTTPLLFHGRVVFGLLFSRWHAFFIETGYRSANLGKLTANASPYLPNSADFNLSGLFMGAGLMFDF